MGLQGYFQAEKKGLRLGEPFSVTFFIKNETDHDAYVLVPRGRADGVRITVKEGKNCQIKDMREEPEPGVVAEVKLSPGDTYSQQFPLSDWLIIKEPGSYTVECAIEIETCDASIRQKDVDSVATKIPFSTELHFTVRPNKEG